MTIFEAYNHIKQKLKAAGIEDSVFEAKVIIKHITGLSNSEILTAYTKELTEYIIETSKDSAAVKAQLEDPTNDIFSGLPFHENTGSMTDEEKISAYAKAAVYWCVFNEVYCGEAAETVGDTLAPKADATRGQIAVMINRYLDREN